MSALSEQECQNELLKNININIIIVFESKVEPSCECWTRYLKHPPVFALKVTNLHGLSSEKDKNFVISETLEKGRQFKNKGYLCSD